MKRYRIGPERKGFIAGAIGAALVASASPVRADTNINDNLIVHGNLTVTNGWLNQGGNCNSNASPGWASHAQGWLSKATGGGAHAEGNQTVASDSNAHAEGQETTASANAAHAEGHGSTASGYGAHAEGRGSTASGYASHAEGWYTTAAASNSHASGRYSEVLAAHVNASVHGTGIASTNKKQSAYADTAHFDRLHTFESANDSAYSVLNRGESDARYPQFDQDNAFTGGTNSFGGNVGIGTSTPAYPLDVVGAGRVSGAVYGESFRAGSGTDGISMRQNGTVGELLGIDQNLGAWNPLRITATGGDDLYVRTDGKVGLGTTNAQEKLHVAGHVLCESNLYAQGNVGIGTNGSAYKLHIRQGDIYLEGQTGGMYDSPRLRLSGDDDSGQVNADIFLDGASSPSLVFRVPVADSTNTATGLTLSGSLAYFPADAQIIGDLHLTDYAGDNTDSPKVQFENHSDEEENTWAIQSTCDLYGNSDLKFIYQGTPILSIDGADGRLVGLASGLSSFPSYSVMGLGSASTNATGDLALKAANNAFSGATNAFSGYVGIGTNGPAYKLHVRQGDLYLEGQTGGMYDSPRLRLSGDDDTGRINADIFLNGKAYPSCLEFRVPISDTTNTATGLRLYNGNAYFPGAAQVASDLSVGGHITNCTDIIASGKVGIGTATPAVSLDVQGNVNATGTVTAAKFYRGDGKEYWVHGTESGSSPLAAEGATAGEYGVALGVNANAGYYGVAVGLYATAPNVGAVALGWGTATNDHAVAMGWGSKAGGNRAVAVGSYAEAKGSGDLAMSPYALASGGACLALGYSAQATCVCSTAIGSSAKGTNAYSLALGAGSATTQDHQIRLGTTAETVSIPGQLWADYVPQRGDLSMGSYTNQP